LPLCHTLCVCVPKMYLARRNRPSRSHDIGFTFFSRQTRFKRLCYSCVITDTDRQPKTSCDKTNNILHLHQTSNSVILCLYTVCHSFRGQTLKVEGHTAILCLGRVSIHKLHCPHTHTHTHTHTHARTHARTHAHTQFLFN